VLSIVPSWRFGFFGWLVLCVEIYSTTVYLYVTTSSKGYYAVLCTGPVLPLPSKRPFAVSPASKPVLEPQQMAPLPASRPGGTSSWSSRGASPSQMSLVHPLSTHLLHRAASTAGAAASHRDTKSGPPTHGWSRMVTSSSPSLWSRTGS
jgi:hypothetical protein